MTSVGTRMEGSTWRTSISLFIREMPVPRLSNEMSREKEARRRVRAAIPGTGQASSTCETNGGTRTEVERAVPDNLVGNRDVAALRVTRLGLHGVSFALREQLRKAH
jgi:hypothetical protein